ncbi:MAG: InlB B-repeat-containing protein [Bacteroidota bacterium]
MKINKFILIFLSMFFAAWHMQGADLHVGSGQEYSTVQAAVDDASPGDVIIVHSGTYREEVKINVDGLTIQPNEADEVIMNGCEPLLDWTSVGSGVYKAVMDWDITESIQMNQIFIDGVMMHEARWPKQPINDNFVLNPTLGQIDDLVKHSDSNKDLIDNDISGEPDERWAGANIYVNLSNPITMKDGQGWTGVVHSKTDSVINIRVKGDTAGIPNPTQGNWEVTTGSYYYLFNPTPSAVAASGGVTALLGDGEWWKKGDTLFVKTPDGNAPASTTSGSNLVEAKKYPFAFRPKENLGVLKNVTIKGLTLFATSITTDSDYNYYKNDPTKDPVGTGTKGLSEAKNVILDSLNIKYVYHTKDAYGDWQRMYNGRSGIVLTGTNCEIKNCSIQYSAASAISVSGHRNKITNNIIYDINYMVGECGAINQGNTDWYTYDHNIGYNTIYNTPHAAISLRDVQNSDTTTPGVARVHHNYVYNVLTHVWDAGVIDEAGELGNWLRVDHNILKGNETHNGTDNKIQIGIYLDWGDGNENYAARYIIDHNVSHLFYTPIQVNHANETQLFNNTCFIKSWWDDIKGIKSAGYEEMLNKGTNAKNNMAQVNLKDEAVQTHNVSPRDIGGTGNFPDYFTDYEDADYTLLSSAEKLINAGTTTPWDDEISGSAPDVGAFEYGVTPWTAGYNTTYPSTYQLTIDNDTMKGMITQVDPNAMYLDGDNAALKVTTIPGYEFSDWTGDVPAGLENDNPLKLLMTSDKSITANYDAVPTDTLTFSISGSGSIEVTPAPYSENKFVYNTGTELTLVPKAAPLFQFDGWSGDIPEGSENDYPLVITLDSSTSITATFTPIPPGGAIYAVAAGVEGNDRYTATDGTIFFSDEEYVNGGRTWSPDPPLPSISGTDDEELFQTERVYSVLAYDFPIPPGNYQIEMGFSELFFTSNNKRVFDVLAEGQVIVDNLDIHSEVGANAAYVTISDTINVTDGNLDIDFNDIKDQPKVSYIKILQTSDSVGNVFTLSTSVNISGSGTVSPSSGVFYQGQNTTITATANAGFKFSNWSGDISDTDNPVTILMDTNKTITANFVEDELFTLTTSAENGNISLSPNQASYYNGTIVNINAVADSGYVFDSWSGDTGVVQDQKRQDIVIDHDMSITAHFRKETGISGLNANNNDITIYPNPNDGQEVNIEMEDIQGVATISVYDITGSKCYEKAYHSKSITIPLSEMDRIKSGYYLVKISTDKNVFLKKLIVK